MTTRNNLHWGTETWYGQSNNLSYTYQNNRITNSGWQYDADGRVLTAAPPDDYAYLTYDARGLVVTHRSTSFHDSSHVINISSRMSNLFIATFGISAGYGGSTGGI